MEGMAACEQDRRLGRVLEGFQADRAPLRGVHPHFRSVAIGKVRSLGARARRAPHYAHREDAMLSRNAYGCQNGPSGRWKFLNFDNLKRSFNVKILPDAFN